VPKLTALPGYVFVEAGGAPPDTVYVQVTGDVLDAATGRRGLAPHMVQWLTTDAWFDDIKWWEEVSA
jgi:hypothetical protein